MRCTVVSSNGIHCDHRPDHPGLHDADYIHPDGCVTRLVWSSSRGAAHPTWTIHSRYVVVDQNHPHGAV